MKEVLAKINELAGVLQQRIEFNNRVGKTTEERAARLNELEAKLDVRTIDLNLREQKIKAVENTVNLIESATALKKEAEEILKTAHKEKDEFSKATVSISARLAAEKQQYNIDKAKLEKDNVLLQKEWAVVNEKKKTLRADLINEIMKSQVK